jgi:3-phosphoshikimate 1-carboxyvinyltransferase
VVSLSALGVDIVATDDGFVVRGGSGLRGGTVCSRGDHRLALLGAVAGLAAAEPVSVVGFDAADVSFPAFRDLLGGVSAQPWQ